MCQVTTEIVKKGNFLHMHASDFPSTLAFPGSFFRIFLRIFRVFFSFSNIVDVAFALYDSDACLNSRQLVAFFI